MLYYICYNLFKHLNISILNHLFDMYSNHLYLMLNTSLKIAVYAETCSSCTACLYVIVSNYCAVRWSRDYFLLEGIQITPISLHPLKIPTGLF